MSGHNQKGEENQTPPSWSTKFLHWFLKEDYYEDIQGDLEEEYKLLLSSKGIRKARRWYSWQIVKLFKPDMAKRIESKYSIQRETTMFKNYLKECFECLNVFKFAECFMEDIENISDVSINNYRRYI